MEFEPLSFRRFGWRQPCSVHTTSIQSGLLAAQSGLIEEPHELTSGMLRTALEPCLAARIRGLDLSGKGRHLLGSVNVDKCRLTEYRTDSMGDC